MYAVGSCRSAFESGSFQVSIALFLSQNDIILIKKNIYIIQGVRFATKYMVIDWA
jgi:hypothetical protein